MTEPVFKAPLPPQESGVVPPPVDKEQPPEVASKDIKQKILPYLWYVIGGTFAVGLILGLMMAGGDSAPPPPDCPLKYVRNPDIQKPLPLCGRTDKTSACILFIMNSSRYDAYAEDFFDTAARLTERNKLLISTDNPLYSKLNIPPGSFVQIKIPSLR